MSLSSFASDYQINHLDKKQQSIIKIASFTANGDLEKLKIALEEGLYNSLTINEINEVLVHAYAYVGFPKSIAGLMTFLDVIEKRKAEGIKDIQGKDVTAISEDMDKNEYGAKVRAKLVGLPKDPPAKGYRAFSPTIDKFLKEHLFADVFARDILDFQTRELVTVSLLVSSDNIMDRFIKGHMKISMNMGLTKEQLFNFIKVVELNIGKDEASKANSILKSLLEK
jgi:alkylhydroperoxidase/carboxymuconolactone decarboxylase family protein YurZ